MTTQRRTPPPADPVPAGTAPGPAATPPTTTGSISGATSASAAGATVAGATPPEPGAPAVATAETAAATAEQATKVYGTGPAAVRALDEATVHIPPRRLTAIMGPSGSGKSTLLQCMAGLDTLTAGRVTLGGQDLAELSDDELTVLRRERIGFVFQAYNLVPTLSARGNILLPLTLGGRDAEPGWFEEVVATVGLEDRLQHRPAELSGGQQQRVAVARALITRPEIVFADEPTGNLDSRAGAEILGFMRRAVDELGQTIAMVTHDPVAAAYADAVVFLADGRVVDHMSAPTAERVLDRIKAFGD